MMTNKHFDENMDEDEIKSIAVFVKIVSPADLELIPKEQLLKKLNETSFQSLTHVPNFCFPPSNIRLDNLNIDYTKSVDLKINIEKSDINETKENCDKKEVEKIEENCDKKEEKKKEEIKKIEETKETKEINKPIIESEEIKNIPSAIELMKEAETIVNSKVKEFAKEDRKKDDQVLSSTDKKKSISGYKKKYNAWVEIFIKNFYTKYCGSFEESLNLVGSGNASSKLRYNLQILHNVEEALKNALCIQVIIPSYDDKVGITLLTDSKETRLKLLTSQLRLQYEFFYKYVDKNRDTASEEEMKLLENEGKLRNEKLGSKKIAERNITKVLSSFHTEFCCKSSHASSSNGKKPRVKRAPKSSTKGKRKNQDDDNKKPPKKKKKVEDSDSDDD
jgi:hypothetical protein